MHQTEYKQLRNAIGNTPEIIMAASYRLLNQNSCAGNWRAVLLSREIQPSQAPDLSFLLAQPPRDGVSKRPALLLRLWQPTDYLALKIRVDRGHLPAGEVHHHGLNEGKMVPRLKINHEQPEDVSS